MSLKVLLDPVYSGMPDTCSSFYKCMSLIDYTVNTMGRTDVFFYLLFPMWEGVSSENPLMNHPNVKVIPYPYLKDRMREYLQYSKELDKIQGFNGDYWDFDIVFTSRTAPCSFTRSVMSSPRQINIGRLLKRIVIFEEMYILGFRPSVAKSDLEAQEIMTLTGYLAADMVLVGIKMEQMEIIKAAKRYLSPAMVKKIVDKMVGVLPLTVKEGMKKETQFRFKKDGDKAFKVGFVGRMEKVGSNLEEMYEVMSKSFIWNGKHKFEFMVCTVSKSMMIEPPKFVKFLQPKRDEFWRLCKEEMDVTLVLHNDAEFSLSIVEPLMLGVPMVVIDQKWSRHLFGKYPFFASNVTEAYALLSMFYNNYEQCYLKFLIWQKEWSKQFTDGTYGLMIEKTYQYMLGVEKSFEEEVKPRFVDKAASDTSKLLAKEAAKKGEFVLFDLVKELGESKQLGVLADKIKDGDRDYRRIVFATPWNEFRYILKYFYGFVDAGVDTGHMKLGEKS